MRDIEFNLIDEHWIKVARFDGSVEENQRRVGRHSHR